MRAVRYKKTALDNLPDGVTLAFVECRTKLGNGVLYGPSKQTLRKLGWSRSTYFNRVRALTHHGLMHKDAYGHYVLLSPSGHLNSTLIFRKKYPTREDIIQEIRLKRFENRLAQHRYARDKKEGTEKQEGAGFLPAPVKLPSTHVQISVKDAMRSMQVSRSTWARFHRYHRKALDTIESKQQVSRAASHVLDNLDDDAIRALQLRSHSRLVRGRSNWLCIRPNAYRMDRCYRGMSKARIVGDILNRYSKARRIQQDIGALKEGSKSCTE